MRLCESAKKASRRRVLCELYTVDGVFSLTMMCGLANKVKAFSGPNSIDDYANQEKRSVRCS